VVTTQNTALDACKVLAELLTKYFDVFGNSTIDVKRVDLSDRGLGIRYRGVVGPPGSLDAIRNLCARVKTAGHDVCWVKEH
jgi:hypothetical protein